MSFDSLAPFYRTVETIVFGNALQRARTAFLRKLNRCRSTLVVGEGDGRFLAALLAANPKIRITCVEQSARMIQLARRGAPLEFVQSKIEEAAIDGTYDAIVTNFFLDCFTDGELSPIVHKLARHAQPNAIWIVGEFTNARRGKLLVALMYGFFRLVAHIKASRLPNYAHLLQRHGFRCAERRLFYGGIVCAELWQRHPELVEGSLAASASAQNATSAASAGSA